MIGGRLSVMEKSEERVEDGFGDVISTEWNHNLFHRIKEFQTLRSNLFKMQSISEYRTAKAHAFLWKYYVQYCVVIL